MLLLPRYHCITIALLTHFYHSCQLLEDYLLWGEREIYNAPTRACEEQSRITLDHLANVFRVLFNYRININGGKLYDGPVGEQQGPRDRGRMKWP